LSNERVSAALETHRAQRGSAVGGEAEETAARLAIDARAEHHTAPEG
jgi:hypothetical protein